MIVEISLYEYKNSITILFKSKPAQICSMIYLYCRNINEVMRSKVHYESWYCTAAAVVYTSDTRTFNVNKNIRVFVGILVQCWVKTTKLTPCFALKLWEIQYALEQISRIDQSIFGSDVRSAGGTWKLISTEGFLEKQWWEKAVIDREHQLAWQRVELGKRRLECSSHRQLSSHWSGLHRVDPLKISCIWWTSSMDTLYFNVL